MGEQVDPEDLGGHEGYGQPEGWSGEHHQQRGNPTGQRVPQEPPDVGVDPAALVYRRHHGRQVVVGEDEIGGLPGDLHTTQAHRDPDVGPPQRRRVVDPSPVIATTCPWRCSAATMSSFCSGLIRAKTATRSRSTSSMVPASPRTTWSPSCQIPRRPAIVRAVAGWSPVTRASRIPARSHATATPAGTAPQRVTDSDHPERAQPARAVARARGCREHPEPRFGQLSGPSCWSVGCI
jgi:hypothetical protein